MKDGLDGKIMKEFAALVVKTYSYSTDSSNKDKKAKSTKKYLVKRKHSLEATQLKKEKNNSEKNSFNLDNVRENHNEFIKKQ